jgi:O-antigen ligase
MQSSVAAGMSDGARATGRTRPTDSYRYARSLLLIFLATALDVKNLLDRASRGGPLRYVILLVPVATILAIRASGSTLIRRPRSYEWLLLVLFAFGLIGTVYGIAFLGVSSTARAVFLPMSLAVLALLVVQPMTEHEAAKLLRAIAWIATIYICLAAVTYIGAIPALAEYRQFKNATFPYVAMGIAAAYLLGHRWLTAGLCMLALVSFLGYPSATSAIVMLVTVITLFATTGSATRARPFVIGVSIAIAIAIALANFSTSTTLATRYFQAVGKQDNNQFRLDSWSIGLTKFQESPIIGSAFASDTVVDLTKTRQAPYHNDFILFLAEGGAVGAALFIGWIVLLLTDITRRYFGFLETEAPEHARLMRLVLVGLNGFIVTMAFNPVLEGLSRSATIFALVAIASTLGTPGSLPERTDVAAAEAPSDRRVVEPGRLAGSAQRP